MVIFSPLRLKRVFVEFSFEKFGQQVVVDLFHKFGF